MLIALDFSVVENKIGVEKPRRTKVNATNLINFMIPLVG
jgi:hypothetical protein